MDKSFVDRIFKKNKVFYSHDCGFNPDKIAKDQTTLDNLTVLATSKTNKGKRFVALIEYKHYPFIGSQFHIEKDQYERVNDNAILSRNHMNIKFTHDMMMNFVAPLREQALNIMDVDSWVLGFSSMKQPLLKSEFFYHE
jgi:hypothetical protein